MVHKKHTNGGKSGTPLIFIQDMYCPWEESCPPPCISSIAFDRLTTYLKSNQINHSYKLISLMDFDQRLSAVRMYRGRTITNKTLRIMYIP